MNFFAPKAAKVIRAIADKKRKAQPGDRQLILKAMSRAQFNPEIKTADEWSQTDYPVIGQPHPSQPGMVVASGTKLSSLEAHLLKRIVDQDWALGTTPAQFLSDIRTAVQLAKTLKVGVYKGPAKAGTVTPRASVQAATLIASQRKAIFVVYNADRDYLQTAYCVPEALVPTLFSGWKGLTILVN